MSVEGRVQRIVGKIVKVLLMVLLVCTVMSYVVKELWNWLMPGLFGLRAITWAQALGLLVLSKLLLGGFHKHVGGGGREWKRGMMERWESMTPEERERVRAGMSRWDRCRFGRRVEEPVSAEGKVV